MSDRLPQFVIGIDVETTALDPAEGEIIEVAAIRYEFSKPSKSSKTQPSPEATAGAPSGPREVERFVRLCKPSGSISQFTTSLTGITNEMVAACNPFSALLPDLQAFIGKNLVFAHNAPFDVKWLTYHGLSLAKNKVWDTFAIASIAWPEAESYNLGQLSEMLGLHEMAVTSSAERTEHAAGFDVELTWQLLQRAQERLIASGETHKKIAELLAKAGLEHYIPLFTSSVASKTSEPNQSSPSTLVHETGSATVPEDLKKMSELFGKDGVLERQIEGFVAREEQMQMAQAVQSMLDEEQLGIIEAPTGTGKTYAYLVPALLGCTLQGKAIISTHTKHLQDQLIEEDVPSVLRALKIERQVTLLKGRRNYVCTQRLARLLERATWRPEEALLLIKILVWLDGSADRLPGRYGDLSRLNLSHQTDAPLVGYIHADALSCRLECEHSETCAYQLARRAAAKASLIIVNHALLVRMASGQEAGLGARTLVIDEAHQLEDVARQASMRNLSGHRLRELVAPIGQLAGQQEASAARHIVGECEALVRDYDALLEQMHVFMTRHTPHDRLRLSPVMRQSAQWQEVVVMGDSWRGRIHFTIGLMEGMTGLSPKDTTLLEEATANLTGFSEEINQFIAGESDRIQWLEKNETYGRSQANVIVLRDVALSAAATLRPVLTSVPVVVLTSATLTIGGSFAYLKRSLGVSPSVELVLTSPFPLKEHLLVYLVTDGPSPTTADYDGYIAEQLATLSHLLSGRILGLFTSKRSVKAVYYQLIRMLNKAPFKLYAQDITGGRTNMLKRFRAQAASILLGTTSFWEGIDVPGDSLSCVVVPRLPFANPYDPILEAVAEAEHLDAFGDLSVPRMVLRLRQGIGRLIRTATDRGVVIIYDRRMHRSDYGRIIKESLPEATVKIGSSRQVADEVRGWIGEEILEQWRADLEL